MPRKPAANLFPSAAEAVSGADIVLLAVKPLVISGHNRFCRPFDRSDHLGLHRGRCVPCHLRRLTGPGPTLVRIMPNTPAMIGSGVSAVCFDQADQRQQQQLVEDLFASCGLVVTVNEDLMDAVTGLSGSGPAYVMLMIEAMADAGVLLGLPRGTAQQMAAMTLMGSAKLVLETGIHPGLKDQVCSSGGTTIEAVAGLEADGLRSALINAVCTAAAKSQQLRETAGKHD